MHRLLPTLLLACAIGASASAPTVMPLTAADVPALLQPPAQGERIVMLWALDCAYCEASMQALATLQRAHPAEIELLTVATDSIALRTRIAARLAAAGLPGYPARAYAAASPEQLNFLIDPEWGGETPRTLVIRADGTRIAVSGALTGAQLQQIAPP